MKKILAVSLLTSLLCGGCALFGGDEQNGHRRHQRMNRKYLRIHQNHYC